MYVAAGGGMMTIVDEIVVKQPGVIAISESLQKKLGLMPGMFLTVETTANGGVQLKIHQEEPLLVEKDGILVYTGRLAENFDIVDFIQREREERIASFWSEALQ